MKYYIISGERSGDLHGSNLIKALRAEDPSAQIRCWGGDEMEKAGGELVTHYKEIAFMGFWEVLINLTTIAKYLKFAKKDIRDFAPDVVILIDYAGFNMKIAKFAKQAGYKTFYYISPKIWAWNQSRALKVKKYVDRMFVILPFEANFYLKYDYKVDYVGNPLLDAINAFEPNTEFRTQEGFDERPIVAVLPGSRKQEVDNMLTVMLHVTENFPEFNFAVAGVDSLPAEQYEEIAQHPNVKLIFNKTYDLLSHAHAAVVTSGTATLEAALFNVPQVVCYKTSPVSYKIAKQLIKVAYISLVNLIADRKIVEELIQREMNAVSVTEALRKVSHDTPERAAQLRDYKALMEIMGNEKASQSAARLMVKYLKQK